MATIHNADQDLQSISDRLTLSDNSNYPALAEMYLPKLLLMMNREESRPAIILILSASLKRIKTLECAINLEPFLQNIQPTNTPFAYNLAVTFVDSIIKYHKLSINSSDGRSSHDPKMFVSILKSLTLFPEFSPQSNALCSYLLHFLPLINRSYDLYKNETGFTEEKNTKLKAIINEWLLDVALIQYPLIKDAVGSIQAGLSSARVERITSKANEWTKCYTNYNKEIILDFLLEIVRSKSDLMLPQYLCAIILAMSVDSDPSIATTARNNFGKLDEVLGDILVRGNIIEYFCSLINPEKALDRSYPTRSALRDEVICTMINWMNDKLHGTYSTCFERVSQTGFLFLLRSKALTVQFLRVAESLLNMLALAAEVVETEKLDTECFRYIDVVKDLLQYFSLGSNNSVRLDSSPFDGNSSLAQEVVIGNRVRKSCYKIVRLLVSRIPHKVTNDIDLSILLFSLLEGETKETVPQLFDALNTLREGYELIGSTDSVNPLKDYLLSQKDSKEPKKRRAVLEWLYSLFSWDIPYVEALVHSYDFPNDEVHSYVINSFERLNQIFSKKQLTASLTDDSVINQEISTESRDSHKMATQNFAMISLLKILSSEGFHSSTKGKNQLQLYHPLFKSFNLGLEYYVHNIPSVYILGDDCHNLVDVSVNNTTSIVISREKSDEVTTLISSSKESILQTAYSLLKSTEIDENHMPHDSKSLNHNITVLRSIFYILSIGDETVKEYIRSNIAVLLPYVTRGVKEMDIDLQSTSTMSIECGSIVAEIIGRSCHVHDLNYLAILKRQLLLKYGTLSQSMAKSLVLNTIACVIINLSQNYDTGYGYDNDNRDGHEEEEEALQSTIVSSKNVDESQIFLDEFISDFQRLILVSDVNDEDSTAQNLTILTPIFRRLTGRGLNDLTERVLRLRSFLVAVLEFVLSFMQNQSHLSMNGASPLIMKNSMEILSRGCIVPSISQEYLSRVWTVLFQQSIMGTAPSEIKFIHAEALLRIALSVKVDEVSCSDMSILSKVMIQYTSQCKLSWDDSWSSILREYSLFQVCLSYIDCMSKSNTLKDKLYPCIMLLVLVQQVANTAASTGFNRDRSFEDKGPLFPLAVLMEKKFILWSVSLFLRFLAENDLMIQDIACLGLCSLFTVSKLVDERILNTENPSRNLDSDNMKGLLQSAIATEVISVITREKRPITVGVDVTEESSQNNPNDSNDVDGTAFSTLIQEALNYATQTNANGNNAPLGFEMDRDALLEAANNMIRQNGRDPREPTNTSTNPNNQTDSNQKYSSIFSVICKISRKGGDPALLFAIISLIKKDPNHSILGVQPNMTATYQYYSPPTVEFNRGTIKQLIPIIYQHRYDPTQSIRDVMKILWDQMVLKHYPLVLTLFEEDILMTLIRSSSSGYWRDREAACNALEIFLPQIWDKSWDKYLRKNHVEMLWSNALRLMDDIRESTRLSGLKYAKSLSELLLKQCDRNHINSIRLAGTQSWTSTQQRNDIATIPNPSSRVEDSLRENIDIYMKLLLHKGFFSSSQISIGFCLGIIIRLVETCGTFLHHWLSELISILIESMSALEPTSLQYLQFHTTRMNISSDELESFRVQLAYNSPIQEALSRCLQHIDEHSISNVLRELSFHLQRGVGLATRVSASQSIIYLSEKYSSLLRENRHSAKAFHLILDTLTSSPYLSPTIKKSFINSQGALAKILPMDIIVTETRQLIQSYRSISRDDKNVGPIISSSICEIIKRSGENISFSNSIWNELLAISYIGLHDSDIATKETWMSLWTDILITSGSGSKANALVRSLSNVLKDITTFLSDLSWKRRTQGLLALQDVVTTIPSQQISPNIGYVVYQLLGLIPGKQIWIGKHHVFLTLAIIVSKCPSRLFRMDSDGRMSKDDLFIIESVEKIPETANLNHEARLMDINEYKTILRTDDIISMSPGSNDESKEPQEDNILAGPIEPSNIDIDSSASAFTNWRISIDAIVAIFIRECEKSWQLSLKTTLMDREYPLHCAKALACLPWTVISSNYPRLFVHILPQICSGADIDLTKTIAQYEAEEAAVSVDRIEKQSTAKESEQLPKKRAADSKLSSSSTKSNVRTSMNAMFGNRYGATSGNKSYKSSKSVAVSRTSQAVASRQPATSTTNLNQSVANTTNILTEELTTNRDDSQHDNAEGDMAMAPSIDMNNLTDVPPVKETPAADIRTGKADAVKEPVYRLKFLESILSGWIVSPEAQAQTVFSDDITILTSYEDMTEAIFIWIMKNAQKELWSIRVIALRLLGKIMSNNTLKNIEHIRMVSYSLNVIELAVIEEKKYSRVRAAGVEALESMLLRPSLKVIIEENFKSKALQIARKGNNDSEPMVIEIASRILKHL